MLLSVQLAPASAPAGRPDEISRENSQLDVRATVTPHGVLVQWTSSFDADILGFNVYRLDGGSSRRLNNTLVAGPSLVSNPSASSFSWFDPLGTSASAYEVEIIDLHGAPSARAAAARVYAAVLPQYRQSAVLGQASAAKGSQTSGPEADGTIGLLKGSAEVNANDSASPAVAQQWAIANERALKIGVRADGWYRITQPQMIAAGFDTTADVSNMQLFCEGGELAIKTSRDSGVLSSTDFIEFWGQGLNTPTTDTRVYWLRNGPTPGKRIQLDGDVSSTTAPAAAPQTSSGPVQTTAANALFSWLPASVSFDTGDSGSDKPSREVTAEKPVTIPALLPPLDLTKSTAEQIMRKTETRSASDAQPQTPVSDPKPPPTSSVVATNSASPAFARANRKPAARSRKPLRSTRRSRRGRRKPRPAHHHATMADTVAPAFSFVTEYTERRIYYTAALNGDRENFFGPVIFSPSASIQVSLKNIEPTSTNPALLQLSLQGVSLGQHQLNVTVNGSAAGSITWQDQASTVQTLSIPPAWLIEGLNEIKFAPLNANDTTLLDYARITYAHSLRADNDGLQFTVKATQTTRIDGFTTGDIRVLDVTDPTLVQEVRPIIEATGNNYAATVPGGDRGKARRFVALPANSLSQPAWLSLNQPSTLNSNTNAGDLIIISYKDFIPSLAPLVAQRQAQGYVVKVVDVDDVFDEFSFGEHTPQAIRDFMSLAKNGWTRAPAYLLLVGDASYDPLNHLDKGYLDFVPTKLVDTGMAGSATALETASDDWFTDFNGDGIADLSVGRLPVRTIADTNLVVSKIVNYTPANAANRGLLVADTQGSYYFNFEAANDQLAAILPATMTIQKIYRRLQASDDAARSNIVDSLKSGQGVTVYSGHGNVDIWGGSIFTATDAAALTNGNRLSFLVVMDCLNGYFVSPTLTSLAESALLAQNGGAVASFASSGLTIPDGQHQMGLQMFQLLYTGSPMAIGDASRLAKAATTDVDVRRTWILFGDPTLKIR
ncbi:MAG TPA: C25 family cysteine peptidase [Pyrinomonadaceae bacterium]|nr:C25 family cysteine peptidase [Pyrinomonadaceae bacterium]